MVFAAVLNMQFSAAEYEALTLLELEEMRRGVHDATERG